VNIPTDDNPEELALNLTPMIDVVFLLLIFFMVATTFLDPEREIDLELPPADSATISADELDEIVVNVLRNGTYVLAGRNLDADGMLEVLRIAARRDPETPVTIRGDAQVAYEAVVRVLDACGVAGLANLSVATLEGS